MFTNSFKNRYTFEQREADAIRVLSKYPDRVPIICERSNSANNIDCPIINKNKYLVSKDMTMGQFMYVIRRKLRIPPEKGMFLFVNDYIISVSQMVGDVYDYYKHSDGFLYVSYGFENTFG